MCLSAEMSQTITFELPISNYDSHQRSHYRFLLPAYLKLQIRVDDVKNLQPWGFIRQGWQNWDDLGPGAVRPIKRQIVKLQHPMEYVRNS